MSGRESTSVRNLSENDNSEREFRRSARKSATFQQQGSVPTGSLRPSSDYYDDDDIDFEEEMNISVSKRAGSIDEDDEEWDTDLEEYEFKETYDASGRATYVSACTDCGVVPASYFLRHMKEASLHMQHHGLGEKGAKAIAIALVTNTYVLHLNLADNALGPSGVRCICDMLKENCYITEMDLSENNISLDGISSLTDVLMNTNNLKKLSLSGNDIDSKSAAVLAEAIQMNTSLKSLNLSHNWLDEQAGLHLGPAIAANECLDVLDLSWNHLRHKGAYSIALSLKENMTLKVLDLSWNGFGNDGALAISDALKENSSLIELDLSNNRITVEGAGHLNKGLLQNDTLRILRIGQNPMQSQGAYLILMAIKNNPNIALVEIELTGIQVNSDFYALLRELSELHPKLQVFHGGAGGAHGKPDVRPKPMKVLQDYVKNNRMRLFDFFSMMDKDKSMSLTITEFANGLKETGIPLTTNELLELIEKLDRDNDGEINYSEFVLGSMEQHIENRKDALKVKAKEERERRILSPELLVAAPRSSITSPRPSSASLILQ
eukprot:gene14126-15604_t